MTAKTAMRSLSVCTAVALLSFGEIRPQSSRADEPSSRAAFVLELQTDRYIGRLVGNQILIGQLDEHGEFHRATNIPPVRLNSPGGSGYDYQVMNLPRVKDERVYEFRSSRLIKGKLDEHGRFIPETGSSVIELSDYKITDDAPRIYNLPGVLVPAE